MVLFSPLQAFISSTTISKGSLLLTSTRLSFLKRHGLSFSSEVMRNLVQLAQKCELSIGRTSSTSTPSIWYFFLLWHRTNSIFEALIQGIFPLHWYLPDIASFLLKSINSLIEGSLSHRIFEYISSFPGSFISFIPFRRTIFSLTGVRPQSTAASIPSITLSTSPCYLPVIFSGKEKEGWYWYDQGRYRQGFAPVCKERPIRCGWNIPQRGRASIIFSKSSLINVLPWEFYLLTPKAFDAFTIFWYSLNIRPHFSNPVSPLPDGNKCISGCQRLVRDILRLFIVLP